MVLRVSDGKTFKIAKVEIDAYGYVRTNDNFCCRFKLLAEVHWMKF